MLWTSFIDLFSHTLPNEKQFFARAWRRWEKLCKQEVYPEWMVLGNVQLLCYWQGHHKPPFNAKRPVSTCRSSVLSTPVIEDEWSHGANTSSTSGMLQQLLKRFSFLPLLKSSAQARVGNTWALSPQFLLQQHRCKFVEYYFLILICTTNWFPGSPYPKWCKNWFCQNKYYRKTPL